MLFSLLFCRNLSAPQGRLHKNKGAVNGLYKYVWKNGIDFRHSVCYNETKRRTNVF